MNINHDIITEALWMYREFGIFNVRIDQVNTIITK